MLLLVHEISKTILSINVASYLEITPVKNTVFIERNKGNWKLRNLSSRGVVNARQDIIKIFLLV